MKASCLTVQPFPKGDGVESIDLPQEHFICQGMKPTVTGKAFQLVLSVAEGQHVYLIAEAVRVGKIGGVEYIVAPFWTPPQTGSSIGQSILSPGGCSICNR